MTEIQRGHLAGMLAPAPPVYRYESALPRVRHYWVPVWDIPAGRSWPQRTLQYPNPLVVIADSYSRFYGVATGLSGVELTGRGYAVGTALRPSAGIHITGGEPLSALTDRWVELTTVPGLAGAALTAAVREAMSEPDTDACRLAAVATCEAAFAAALPATDPEGDLVDAICEFVETDPDVVRVTQICTRFGVGERRLQRLLERRIGLTPKWLIRRRRLQDAAFALRTGADVELANLAVGLGYADQAHFTRDFTTVVGVTPKRFRDELGWAAETGPGRY